MLPSLSALIVLQRVDSASEAARRRLEELPAVERASAAEVATAVAEVEAAKARLQSNQAVRRALEKDVAAVDVRLARFDDHKAAVKTNQEYTALLHEIAGAKAEKDAIEEKILEGLEEADAVAAEIAAADAAVHAASQRHAGLKASLDAEARALQTELQRLSDERAREIRAIEPRLVAKYEQLLKQRRHVAMSAMVGEICSACHVRLRPSIAQQVRRNEDIVQCDSCQRILYFDPATAAAPPEAARPS